MVFVTGATGLVGRYLVDELLRNGEQVRALCRPQSDRQVVHAFLAKAGTDDARLEWVEGSLHDGLFLEEAMAGCKRVFHCAAMVSFHPKDAETMMRINRDATGLVVNAMLHLGVEELVHVSSVAALGRKPGEPVHEDVPFEDGPRPSTRTVSTGSSPCKGMLTAYASPTDDSRKTIRSGQRRSGCQAVGPNTVSRDSY